MPSDMLEFVLKLLMPIIMGLVAYWVRRIEKDVDSFGNRLSGAEKLLSEYREKHAVGETELRAIRSLLQDHVEREENVTWKRIEMIDQENQAAHQKLFESIATLHGDVRELVGLMGARSGSTRRTPRGR